MTGDLPARSATIRSQVPHADAVAAALAADDTDDIHTRVEADAVVTDVERPTTASLEATVDDYVVGLGVATAVASIDALPDGDPSSDAGSTDAGSTDDDTSDDCGDSMPDGDATADDGSTDGHSTGAQDGDYASGRRDESDCRGDDNAGDDTTDAHDTL